MNWVDEESESDGFSVECKSGDDRLQDCRLVHDDVMNDLVERKRTVNELRVPNDELLCKLSGAHEANEKEKLHSE